MLYTQEDVFSYVEQEDVKFIRLVFCDAAGKQKNIAIMPQELKRAFSQGISFDGSAVGGFSGVEESDLFLFPIPETLTDLPWRPSRGKVVRMLCNIRYPDGRPYPMDCRALLANAVREAKNEGITVQIGAEFEFYLFKTDADGNPTTQPFDHAGYMDVAPEDKGENVRREICLMLEQMGIQPECSHHESGPGQNEIDFRYSDPLTAADNAVTFRTVVRTAAAQNGLCASFSPKPLPDRDGSGMHINISAQGSGQTELPAAVIAGVLDKAAEITLFLNPCEESYRRLGHDKAPRYVTWSEENRSQLIRIPAAIGENRRAELRSADATANPYLAYALLIHAGLHGIENGLVLPPATDLNLYTAPAEALKALRTLPGSLAEAAALADASPFVRAHLPASVIRAYTRL